MFDLTGTPVLVLAVIGALLVVVATVLLDVRRPGPPGLGRRVLTRAVGPFAPRAPRARQPAPGGLTA